MSDNADDLLDELEQLEHASEKMADDVQQAKDKQSELGAAEAASELDAAALSLESSKTAQLAAEQSQKAAEAAVKMTHEQKAQLMELGDANVAWRQALRTASRDLKSSKNAVSIMMGVTVTVSLSAAGAMGWMLYHLTEKQQAFENEVADILTTESRLFQKDMTIKVDQLASLIESLVADIRRLSQTESVGALPVLEGNNNTDQADVKTAEASQPEAKSETAETMRKDSANAPHSDENTPATDRTAAADLPEESSSQTSPDPQANAAESLAPVTTQVQALSDQSQAQQKALAQIQEKLERLLTLQSQLEAKTLAELAELTQGHQQKPATPTEAQGASSEASTASSLSDEQAERLKAIAWSAFQERKMLKRIEASLKELSQALSSIKAPTVSQDTQTGPALNKITQQLDVLDRNVKALKTQQSQIEQKVEKLDALTQKLAAKPDPYRYRAPDKAQE
ncbi:hypothetical protein [Thiomicrospira sp. WB1]|uniref:hypothetical protein n=1 Tax=Thiomicrospira sp. WB1 TaxID=1685380 RepID=UPI000747D34F|nr:hypothetical protein [Thiomicrospira sp. WB1]KUJ72746.1 hypothetical protein AVO41_02845 [Thiomicrospira sp. WB1]